MYLKFIIYMFKTQIHMLGFGSFDQRHLFTCLGVDGKKSLWISTGYFIWEIITWFRVQVKCLDLDDRDVFGRVLRYRGIVHRLCCQWSIIIDILNLDVNLHKWRKWHNSLVCSIDCKPVMISSLTIKGLLCPYNACDKEKKKEHVALHEAL